MITKLLSISLLLVSAALATPPDGSWQLHFTDRAGDTATDNVSNYTVTTATALNTTAIPNSFGCLVWQLTYSSEGFSGVSIQLQDAQKVYNTGPIAGSNNISFGPSAWSAFQGTATLGTNPLTSTSQGNYIGYGYYPYINVNVTLTGTGTTDVQLQCWKSIFYAQNQPGFYQLGVCTGTTTCTANLNSQPSGTVLVIYGIVTSSAASAKLPTLSGCANTTFTSQSQTNITASFDHELVTAVVSGGNSCASIVITPSAASTHIALTVFVLRGANTASLLDGSLVTNTSTSTSPSTGAYSTTKLRDFVFTGMICLVAVNTTPAPPYVTMTQANAASAARSQGTYLYNASIGAQSSSWTINTSNLWATMIVGFKAI